RQANEGHEGAYEEERPVRHHGSPGLDSKPEPLLSRIQVQGRIGCDRIAIPRIVPPQDAPRKTRRSTAWTPICLTLSSLPLSLKAATSLRTKMLGTGTMPWQHRTIARPPAPISFPRLPATLSRTIPVFRKFPWPR